MAKNKKIAFGLLAVFVIFRMGLDFVVWRKISVYASYLFEAMFVSVAWYLYRDRIRMVAFQKAQVLTDLLLPLGAGFVIYRLAVFSLIPIPFDLTGWETIFLLTLFGPVLEELIFRMGLWEPMADLFADRAFLLVTSTVLFSIGHLLSLWVVPQELRSFVLYQSLYVILLGLGTGWRRLASSSLIAPILVHMSFNIGFFLASR